MNTTALNASAVAATEAPARSPNGRPAGSDGSSWFPTVLSMPEELSTIVTKGVQQSRKVPICLLVSLCCLILHYFPGIQYVAEFHFGDAAIHSPLAMITCHWLHWSDSHLFWDLAVFAVVGMLCEFQYPQYFRQTLFLSSILIPLLVMISQPHLLCYRGLSGVDSAFVALLVTRLLLDEIQRRNPNGIAMFSILLVLQFLKIAAEVLAQGNLFVTNGDFIPVPLAHLTGAAIGCSMALVRRG